MPPVIAVRQLSKNYGEIAAVRDVGFDVAPGEIFGLLGPNGAGKTTTIECLTGLREADTGELTICGLDGRRQRNEVKQRLGVALQSTALPDTITPREALRLFGAFYRRHAGADELLERFDLVDRAGARYHTLSGGERQRLALALAFVNRPEAVLLDEPTAGLDPKARHELRGQIARMKTGGCAVLLTTHDLDEAGELCDRVAIIDHGRIVATGAPRELVARPAALQSVVLLTAPPLAAETVARLPGVSDLACDGGTARFRTSDAAATLAALADCLATQGGEIVDLHVRKATLTEIFLELTGDGNRKESGERAP